MIIYIVTTGEYSDYGIHSLWSTKEKAEGMKKILDLNTYSDARIQEYELDGEAKEKPGVRVLIDANTGEIIPEHGSIKYPHDDICRTPHTYYQENYYILREIPGVHGKQHCNTPTIEALHFTLEQALKAARDKRMAVLALRNGI